MAREGLEEMSSTGLLVGHPLTDSREFRRGILAMCQEMGLGKKFGLEKRPISEEGFLEEAKVGLAKGYKIFFLI